MNSHGFVLIALDGDIDYSRLAYACALSIKHSQPKDRNHVTVFTDNPEAFEKYTIPAIDSIQLYQGPPGMDSRSRVYDLTPYEHTIFLDADMLILDDLTSVWQQLSNHYLYVASQAQTFRGELVEGYGPYRKVFEQYQLPNLYNAFTYFKKSDSRAKEFFDLVKIMTDNPRAFVSKFLPGSVLLTLPTDEAFALAAQILDIDGEITDNTVAITHMKPMLQRWGETARWTSTVRLDVTTAGVVRVGQYVQTGLLHYVDKDAINNTVLSTLEELVCNKI